MKEWPKEIINIAKAIKLVIMDVDGVLTDGGLYFTDDGREIKKFNVKDGLGMTWLMQSGIEVAIITGRTSVIVAERMKSLGINHVYQGRMNKLETYNNLKQALDIDDSQVAYIGDDLIDVPILKRCALPCTVADAHHFAKEHALIEFERNGGCGSARMLCDLILQAQDKFQPILDKYQ
ncbi:KdsC family phosphatase [Marinicella sp. W31]|uniref:KdsC family phosphatase n=1 Tax=Marinicella sp. W31 TaxID=3023713 RepID=UPI00375837F2